MNAARVINLPRIGAPYAIAYERIARPVVLAVGIWIELAQVLNSNCIFGMQKHSTSMSCS